MNKSQKAASGIAAGVVAAGLAFSTVVKDNSHVVEMEIPYSIEKTEYSATLSLKDTDALSADIVELYLNGDMVTDGLLPNCSFTSIPLVYSDLENLTLTFYKVSEPVGQGYFENDVLHVSIDKSAVNMKIYEAAKEAK